MFKNKGVLWSWGLAMVLLGAVVVGCDSVSPTEEETQLEKDQKKLNSFVDNLVEASSFYLNFGLAVNGIVVSSSEEFEGVTGFPGLDNFGGSSNTSTSTVLATSDISSSVRAQLLGGQEPTNLPSSLSSEYCKGDGTCQNDGNWYFFELSNVDQLGGADLKHYIRTSPPGNPILHSNPGSVTRLDVVDLATGEATGGTFEIKWDIYLEVNATDSTTYDGAYRVTAQTVDGVSNGSFIEITFTGLTVGEDSVSGTFREKISFVVTILSLVTTIELDGFSTFNNFGSGGGGSGYLYFGNDPGTGDGGWASKSGPPIPFTTGRLVNFTIDPVDKISAGNYKVKYKTYLNPEEEKVYPAGS